MTTPQQSSQVFPDLLGGEWQSTPDNPLTDGFWFRNIGSTALILAQQPGSTMYSLIGMVGPGRPKFTPLGDYRNELDVGNIGSTALILAHQPGGPGRPEFTPLGDYRNELDALKGVKTWLDYLERGGTIEAWKAHKG
jgi:hypothetical protein